MLVAVYRCTVVVLVQIHTSARMHIFLNNGNEFPKEKKRNSNTVPFLLKKKNNIFLALMIAWNIIELIWKSQFGKMKDQKKSVNTSEILKIKIIITIVLKLT